MQTDIKNRFSQSDLADLLETIPAAITVVDLQGTVLYYNAYASSILDRKPEHLGQDIRQCHQKSESIEKIDKMLAEFKNGSRTVASYDAHRYGNDLSVVFTPLEKEGRLSGLIQTVTVKRSVSAD